MDFLSLIKDIISMVVIANAVTRQKPRALDEDYMDTLEKILSLGNNGSNN